MSLLFQPIRFGSLQIENRILIAPMCQYSADENGLSNFWHAQQWASFALSGAGLVIIEATAVQPQGRISYADLGLWNDQQRDQIKATLQQIKQYSAVPFAVQLAHAGRKASVAKAWDGGHKIPADHPLGWQTVAPSAIPFLPTEAHPTQLSIDEIQQIIKDFASAALRAVDAGFDLIEIHAAHGYLLHQFLSPLSNHRTDAYGGGLENRLRLTLEVLAAIRAVVPRDYPIGVRISATDWVDAGWDVEASIQLSQQLEQHGVAYIHVSTAGLDARQEIKIGPHYQVPFAQAIKNNIKTPVIAVGLITEAEQAEQLLQHNQADAIALARTILYQPRWPWQAAATLGETIKIAPQYLRCAPRDQQKLFVSFSEDAQL